MRVADEKEENGAYMGFTYKGKLQHMSLFNGNKSKGERFHRNGVLAWKSNSKNGKFQGRQWMYFKDGTPAEESIYMDDRLLAIKKMKAP